MGEQQWVCDVWIGWPCQPFAWLDFPNIRRLDHAFACWEGQVQHQWRPPSHNGYESWPYWPPLSKLRWSAEHLVGTSWAVSHDSVASNQEYRSQVLDRCSVKSSELPHPWPPRNTALQLDLYRDMGPDRSLPHVLTPNCTSSTLQTPCSLEDKLSCLVWLLGLKIFLKLHEIWLTQFTRKRFSPAALQLILWIWTPILYLLMRQLCYKC